MNNFRHDLAVRSVKLINPLLMAAPFAVCWFACYAAWMSGPLYSWGNLVMLLLFLFLYISFGKVYDGFLVSINRISEMVYSQVLALFLSDFLMYIVICLLFRAFANPLPLLAGLAVQAAASLVWCYLAHKWYFTVFPAKRSTIVYHKRPGLDLLVREYGLDKKFDVRAMVSAQECLEHLRMLESMEVVFLSGIHSHDRNIILKYCVEHNIVVYVIPRIGDVLMSGARTMHLFHLPILQAGRYRPSPYYLFFKRVFDILASGIAVVLLSPVFVGTAAAIKGTDGGPVFYKQRRLTKDGKVFDVLKFRSMRVDAEKDGIARLSTGENDDRITPVGKVIRKVRIDELPQLFNILKGDMTICGPRPERPEIAAQYEAEMPEFRLRLQAKAGLTGYAQVYGKYNTKPYDKLVMDLMYIAHPSFSEDFRIMLATVKILFMKDSTEGVQEGAVTAAEDGKALRKKKSA